MCAIVDANVMGEVVGNARSEAGEYFYDWLDNGGTLIAGGKKFLSEMSKNQNFLIVFNEMRRTGRAYLANSGKVDAEERAVRARNVHQSKNDKHILALAMVSGARLLFTNDLGLQKDFGNPGIINNPRGTIYTTRRHKDVRAAHRRTLGKEHLCNLCRR